MKVPGLNLGDWLERLGVRRPGWAPEMLEAITPVHVVSDGSALVAPLLPATVLAGGNFAGAALTFTAFQLQSIASGGTFVRALRFTVPALTFYGFRIQAAPTVFPVFITPTRYNMGPVPGRSVLQIGQVAASTFSSTDPSGNVAGNVDVVLDDVFFVPPGQTLYLEFGTNSQVALAVTWQEVGE